jgi:hypothetical protein
MSLLPSQGLNLQQTVSEQRESKQEKKKGKTDMKPKA